MEETSYQDALAIIRNFLVTHQFSAEQASDSCQDGHWMLWWIETKANCCPSARDASLLQLLYRLEQGYHVRGQALQSGASNWSRADSKNVLELAHIPEEQLEQCFRAT